MLILLTNIGLKSAALRGRERERESWITQMIWMCSGDVT